MSGLRRNYTLRKHSIFLFPAKLYNRHEVPLNLPLATCNFQFGEASGIWELASGILKAFCSLKYRFINKLDFGFLATLKLKNNNFIFVF